MRCIDEITDLILEWFGKQIGTLELDVIAKGPATMQDLIARDLLMVIGEEIQEIPYSVNW